MYPSWANYNFVTGATANFTINKANLNVDAVANSKTYGASDPALGNTLSGFQNGENSGSAGVSGAASCTRALGETVAGSPYTITCTAGTLSAANYNFVTGTTATIHNCNLPDGSLDRRCFAAKSATHHVYLIETSSLTEPTLDLGITSFGSRINVYELLAGGRKTSLDSTGLMQIVFVAKGQMIPVNAGAGGGALCTDERACAALVAQKADGGIWFSGTWFLTERKGIETPAIR
jgi:hypothetical protein